MFNLIEAKQKAKNDYINIDKLSMDELNVKFTTNNLNIKKRRNKDGSDSFSEKEDNYKFFLDKVLYARKNFDIPYAYFYTNSIGLTKKYIFKPYIIIDYYVNLSLMETGNVKCILKLDDILKNYKKLLSRCSILPNILNETEHFYEVDFIGEGDNFTSTFSNSCFFRDTLINQIKEFILHSNENLLKIYLDTGGVSNFMFCNKTKLYKMIDIGTIFPNNLPLQPEYLPLSDGPATIWDPYWWELTKMGVLKCEIMNKYFLLYKETLNIDKVPFNKVKQIGLERYKHYTFLKDVNYNQLKLLTRYNKL